MISGLGRGIGQQAGQGGVGLDLGWGQFQHPPPGRDRLRLVAELAQGAGQPSPGRPITVGIRQDAQVLQGPRLEALAGQQLGQPVVSM